ncbi:unnamed protein product, partial [Mesorhabditis belari]|uniref:Adenylate cyclase-associated CAP C-terminal domain-containing protein n=1 Tax=Mesorhabditis belari TaxID=2138241 RepID=A0AAF3F8V9_9BILA
MMRFADGRQWNVEYFESDPNITVNVTDKKQTVYIFKSEIIIPKSSEMNVFVPEDPDGDFIELPIPERFKTVFKNGKLETTVAIIC